MNASNIYSHNKSTRLWWMCCHIRNSNSWKYIEMALNYVRLYLLLNISSEFLAMNSTVTTDSHICITYISAFIHHILYFNANKIKTNHRTNCGFFKKSIILWFLCGGITYNKEKEKNKFDSVILLHKQNGMIISVDFLTHLIETLNVMRIT